MSCAIWLQHNMQWRGHEGTCLLGQSHFATAMLAPVMFLIDVSYAFLQSTMHILRSSVVKKKKKRWLLNPDFSILFEH